MKTPATRLNLNWCQRLFRELTGAEKALVRTALGAVPWHDHDDETLDDLWAAVERGEVAVFTARHPQTDAIALASFYAIKELADGTKNFHSVATIAIDPAFTDWMAEGMKIMEAVAKAHGCHSMSMNTLRPGLARELAEKHGWFPSEIVLRKLLPDHGS